MGLVSREDTESEEALMGEGEKVSEERLRLSVMMIVELACRRDWK